MEGLEVSEARLHQLEATARIDSEFYERELIALDSKLQKANTPTLSGLCRFVAGPFGSEFLVENYIKDGQFRYIRGKDVKPFFIEEDDNVYIPQSDFERLSEYSLQEGDILLSVVGTLGNASIVTQDNIPAIFSCKSTVLRCHTENPWFLITYLNSSIGQKLMLRRARGAVQTGLNLPDIRALFVPSLGERLKTAIGDCAKLSNSKVKEARKHQAQSEETLLRVLGLEGWEPPEPLTYTRSASEVLPERRLDSEYYRPRFDAVRSKLAHKYKTMSLAEMGEVMKGWSVPYSESGVIPIIRSGDLKDISQVERFLRAEETEDVFELCRGDVLISSIGFGSIGKIQMFDKEGKFGTVSEVTVVRQNKVRPYYLTLFLRSRAGQMQIEQYITGATGQLHLYPRDVAKIQVPIVEDAIQEELEAAAANTIAARDEAQKMLALAKSAVEIAIEQGEAAATNFLKGNVR